MTGGPGCDPVPVHAPTPEALPAIRRQLGMLPFGIEVAFSVIRDNRPLTITVAPAEKGKVEGSSAVLKRWGFTAKAINRFDTPNLHFYQPEGVFVFGVKKFSSAGRAGLLKDDIILKINNKEIKSLNDLLACYMDAAKNADVQRGSQMTVMRNGATLQLPLYFNEVKK